MDKSVMWQFDSYMQELFQMQEVDIKEYSPLTLAFIGDGIYDLIIRTLIVNKGNKQVQKLHLETSALVQASTQSKMMRCLQEILTEEEHAVYKRGRNAKSGSTAKNASVGDYRKATALEALMGYLFLLNQEDRILFLVKEGLKRLEINI